MIFHLLLCTYVRSVLPQMPLYRKSVAIQPYISRLKIKTNEIRKQIDRRQKSFHEIVLLGTVRQIDGIMGKCTFSTQAKRNSKVGRCQLWTGHHNGDSERLSSQLNISRCSEVDTPRGVQASLFY